MLSGETAAGNHPVESVQMMNNIITIAEGYLNTNPPNEFFNGFSLYKKEESSSSFVGKIKVLIFLTIDEKKAVDSTISSINSSLPENYSLFPSFSPNNYNSSLLLSSTLLFNTPHFIFSPEISVVRKVCIYKCCFGLLLNFDECFDITNSSISQEESRKNIILKMKNCIKEECKNSIKENDFVLFFIDGIGFKGFNKENFVFLEKL
jgi:hypothetical protein